MLEVVGNGSVSESLEERFNSTHSIEIFLVEEFITHGA